MYPKRISSKLLIKYSFSSPQNIQTLAKNANTKNYFYKKHAPRRSFRSKSLSLSLSLSLYLLLLSIPL